MEVETSFGTDSKQGVDISADGTVKPAVSKADGEGLTLDVTKPEAGAPPPADDKKPAVEGDKKPEAAEVKPEADKKPDAPAVGMPPDLGEYKPDDQETVSKFDAQYFTEDGKLNKDALSAEFWGNENKLRDSTYAYLENRLGVSKELVNEIEDGLVAKAEVATVSAATAVHEVAGGKERYDAAIKWGLGDPEADPPVPAGYTPEQRARFDKVVTGKAEGWEDAVTALVSRYDAANGTRKMPNLPQRRASTPARDVTNERGNMKPTAVSAPAAEPFKDNAEYVAALRDAGKDPRKSAAVRERLRVSPWAATA